jgi:DNA-binding response OmpR family regulator
MSVKATSKSNGHPTQPVRKAAVNHPARLRFLYVTGQRRIGAWLFDALAREIPSKLHREEVVGAAGGLARLQEEDFDLVLISHEPPELDALQWTQAARGAGTELPLIILGNQSEQELAALCFEQGADGYLCAHTATARTVFWIVTRAVERCQLIRENRRLAQAEEQRRTRDQEEATRLLEEEREILRHFQGMGREASYPARLTLTSASAREISTSADTPACDALVRWAHRLPTIPLLPPSLVNHYRELLRTCVIMGSGTLRRELAELVDILAATGISAHTTLELHLNVVRDLIRGLGSRSCRHVLNRSHLLIVELLMRLADSYRERFWEREHPATQLFLPGFEPRLGQAA